MRTIKVGGLFGPKDIDKDEFIKVWVRSISDLHYLLDYETVEKLQSQIEMEANLKFERLYLKQNPKQEVS